MSRIQRTYHPIEDKPNLFWAEAPRRPGTKIYFERFHCDNCSTHVYIQVAKSSRPRPQHFCNQTCRKEYMDGGEPEIIIPKVVSHDIGWYLTFGRIFPIETHHFSSKKQILYPYKRVAMNGSIPRSLSK